MVLALVVQRRLNILPVYVKTALLSGSMEAELNIAQPEGFVVKNKRKDM